MFYITNDDFLAQCTPEQAQKALWYYRVFGGVPSPPISGFENLFLAAGYLVAPMPDSNKHDAWAYVYTRIFKRDLAEIEAIANRGNE